MGERARKIESNMKKSVAIYVQIKTSGFCFKIKALSHFFGHNLVMFWHKAFILKYLQKCWCRAAQFIESNSITILAFNNSFLFHLSVELYLKFKKSHCQEDIFFSSINARCLQNQWVIDDNINQNNWDYDLP